MPESIIRTLDLAAIAAPPVDRGGSAPGQIQSGFVGDLARVEQPESPLTFEFAKIDDHGRFSGRMGLPRFDGQGR